MAAKIPGMRARLHSLDTLRAFLMLLGVIFHSVQFSLTGHRAMASAPAAALYFDAFIFFVHSWRMPAFFLLSGFFTELLAERRGWNLALRNRLRRVGLPFLLSIFVILPINVFFISAYVDLAQGRTGSVFTFSFLEEALFHRLRKPKLHHLWFLYYLLGFFAVYFAARPAFLRWRLSPRLVKAILYAGLFGALLLMPTPFNVDAPDSILPRWPEFFFYLGFFLLGANLFGDYRRKNSFPTPDLSLSAVGLALSFLGLGLSWFFLSDEALFFGPARFTVAGLKLFTVLASTYFLIALFQRGENAESRPVRFLTLASFFTYLVHEPLINIFGTVFGTYAWPMPLEILFTATLTYLTALCGYGWLVRGTWLDRLLNGPGAAVKNEAKP